MRLDARAWLFDVVEAAQRVQRFVDGRTHADYLADELLRAGVERQFEIMGEALSQLPPGCGIGGEYPGASQDHRVSQPVDSRLCHGG